MSRHELFVRRQDGWSLLTFRPVLGGVMVWLGVSCLVTGAVVAVAGRRSPRRRRLFEMVSGGLLLAGLGLIGARFVLVA